MNTYEKCKELWNYGYTIDEAVEETPWSEKIVRAAFKSVRNEAGKKRAKSEFKRLKAQNGRAFQNTRVYSGYTKFDWLYSLTKTELKVFNSILINGERRYGMKFLGGPLFAPTDQGDSWFRWFRYSFNNPVFRGVPQNLGEVFSYTTDRLKDAVLDRYDSRCIRCGRKVHHLTDLNHLKKGGKEYKARKRKDIELFWKVDNKGPIRYRYGALDNIALLCGACNYSVRYMSHNFPPDDCDEVNNVKDFIEYINDHQTLQKEQGPHDFF